MKKASLLLLLFGFFNHLYGQPSPSEQLASIIQQDSAFQANEFSNPGQYFPSVSSLARKKRNSVYKSELTSLSRIDGSKLTEQEKINLQLLTFILESRVKEFESGFYQINLNAEGGWFSDFVLWAENQTFNSSTSVVRYLEKLSAYPNHNDAQIELMRAGMASNRTLPKFLVNNALGMVSAQCVPSVEESSFFKTLSRLPSNISDDEKEEFISDGRDIIANQVLPAYQKLKDFLEQEYIPKADEAIGISTRNGGTPFYEQRVRYFTTLDMNPEDVFETGQKEVARIRKEMEAIIDEVGYTGTFAEFLEYLRSEEQFYAKTPDEILGIASYISKKIDGQLPRYFYKLPRNSYGVEPVPAAIAPNYTSGRYSPGSLKDGKAGNYWVNTTKLDSRPLYALPALTLHEAVPGHHLQISLAQEMEGLPAFRRNTYLSAFGEGWALYCEWLGEEMGIYETPYERFGKLTYEMWRACRLVVDPGIHVKGWSRQQAIDFLSGNTALSIHECTTEIDRYIGWPGQAVSYKIGELKIRELRKKAESELGNGFDLRAFHDLVLSNGAVPLFILEEMVEEWIKNNKK